MQIVISDLKLKWEKDRQIAKEFVGKIPFARTKNEVRNRLELSILTRVHILRKIPSFFGLSDEACLRAALSFEEIEYTKGQFVITQGELGDCLYILETGDAIVLQSSDLENPHIPFREVWNYTAGAYFGEVALLTSEPRSASVKISSEFASLLRMTKDSFDKIIYEAQIMMNHKTEMLRQQAIENIVSINIPFNPNII